MATATQACVTLAPIGYSTENPYYLTRPKTWHGSIPMSVYQESTTSDETYITLGNYSGGTVGFQYTDPFNQYYQAYAYCYYGRMNYVTIEKPWFNLDIYDINGNVPRATGYFLKFDRTPTSHAEAEAIYNSSPYYMNQPGNRNYFACPTIWIPEYEWEWSVYIKDQTKNVLHFLPLPMFNLFNFIGSRGLNIIGLSAPVVTFESSRAASMMTRSDIAKSQGEAFKLAVPEAAGKIIPAPVVAEVDKLAISVPVQ